MRNIPENRYLRERTLYPALIDTPPAEDLAMIVVIPAHREPDLAIALRSLAECEALENGRAEVIVVLNESESAPPAVRIEHAAQKAALEPEYDAYFIHPPSLPKKHAGVGLARKIGMDEACRRFESLDRDGVIVCFDGDSRCTPNHYRAIHAAFDANPKAQAASIHFEHPIEGDEYPPEVYDAIIGYELHLRCFIDFQKLFGLPYAIQTIGSSMAVRSRAYQAQNGMNRRKAGEDFYFLHKFTALGAEAVIEIDDTMVIPSPRVSDRVPFGTGKAVGELIASGASGQMTYAPQTFIDLASFTNDPEATDLPDSIATFLETLDYRSRIAEIRKNTATEDAFRARFFRWFDAFQLMKFAHFSRDHFHPNVPVLEAANQLWLVQSDTEREALLELRERWQNDPRQGTGESL